MKIPAYIKNLRRSPWKLLSILVPLAMFGAGWWLGLPPTERDETTSDKSDTIWTCSMHPQIRQPNPGLCPICNMDLIPLQDDGSGGLREVSVTPEAAALLNLRVSPVVRSSAGVEIRLFGRINYNERRITKITSRVSGRLDRLFVDFTGALVRKGDHLAEIYSPDLLVAQRELIESKRAVDRAASDSPAALDTRRRLLEAAREKLRLLQFSDKQIKEIENSAQPSDHLTLHAPQAGIVTNKFATEGQYVKTGDPLFTVADLSEVWLNLEAYEKDLQWLRYGQEVEFTVDALPGSTFTGTIAFIDPEIDPVRRIARVRVNVSNPDLALKPGMFAEAMVRSTTATDGRVLDPSLEGKWISPMHPEIVKDGPGACDICGMDLVPAEQFGVFADKKDSSDPLLIPASAVLRTGERAVVYVRTGTDAGISFEGREIVLGPKVGEQFIVVRGLEEGELVVSRGAFKLDSELQIKAKPSMMNPDAGIEELPAGSAPADLAGQWAAMPRLLHRLIEKPAPETIASMISLVEDINTEWLQPDELKLWREFSNRLLNHLTVAKEEISRSPQSAVRRVARAMETTGVHLGLPYQPAEPATADESKIKALRQALGGYLPIAKALADDDDEAAASAAKQFATQAPADFRELAEAVADASDIKARRKAFKPLSEALIASIRESGIDAVGNAYVVHCPMAFDDTGADWLSAKPEILNPYYGDAMLTCGTIDDLLSYAPEDSDAAPEPKPKPKGESKPEAHDH
ncbi:MAG: efflux RND transporter periplasmic adaptor subunit [Akkermansiaceae bacterium]|nr:efflux RND transporter periplasmic adaptor subunit [Akkermansiaceae bacterium]